MMAEHHGRRALHQPPHSARPRRRRELPDGGVRPASPRRRLRQRRVHPDEPDAARRRSTRRCWRSRRSSTASSSTTRSTSTTRVEFTLNRRMSNNWSMMASYRWSRLRGNFEGFYREDNGQSDPGHLVALRFPDQRSDVHVDRRTALGISGDIRFLGDANGILPLDRPHQVKMFGNYMFPFGLNLGLGLNIGSGKPLTPLDAESELRRTAARFPTRPRGTGIQTVDGFKTRTPIQSQFDFQAPTTSRSAARARRHADGGHLQPVQPADGARLRQLDVDLVRRRSQPELRPAARRACSPATRRSIQTPRQAASASVRRPLRVKATWSAV